MIELKFIYNYDSALIASANQSGKSTLIKNIISKIPKEDALILDTQNGFKEYPNRLFPIHHNAEIFDAFIIKARTLNNKTIVLDDADLFNLKNSKQFIDLLIGANHQRLGVILSVRRVLGINKILLQNIHYLIFSSNIPLEDKEYLNKALGKKLDWETIDKLPQYHFIVYDTYTREYNEVETVI